MKKLFIALMACMVLTSCSTSPNETSKTVEPVTVTQTLYKEETVSMPEDYESSCRLGYADGVKFIYQDKQKVYKIASYDDDMNVSSTKELFSAENIWNTRFHINENGTVSVFIVYVKSDAKVGDENYFNDAEVSYELRTFSADGVQENAFEINELNKYYDVQNDFIQDFLTIGDSYVLQTSSAIITLDGSGEITDVIENNTGRICYGTDNDGNIVCAGQKGYTYMDKIAVPGDDEFKEYGKYLSLMQGIAAGHGDFKVFFMLNNGIYGLTASGEVLEIMNYNKSLISCNDYYEVVYAGEGKFAGFGANDNTGTHISLMTVRPDDYVMNREKVTLGAINCDGTTRELISIYNKKSDKYTVDLKSYDDFDDIKAAVLTGESPDLCTVNPLEMKKLANLGAVADMYELSEKYGGFRKDDILDNIIQAYEYKGGLYMMSQKFSVSYMAGLKDNFPDGHLSYQEFFDKANSLPEDVYLGGERIFDTKESVFSTFCLNNINSWIDFDNGECHFDTPEFTQLLEFVSGVNLAPSIDWQELNRLEDNGTITYDDYHAIWLDETMRVKNGTALVFYDFFNRPADLGDMKEEYGLRPEEVTYIYPLNGGSGLVRPDVCYSIFTTSNCIEGAWDYMNFLMSGDLLENYLQTRDSFVTRKDSFGNIMHRVQEQTINPIVANPDGTFTSYYHTNEPITDENIKAVTDYIGSCTSLQGYSPEVWDIVLEEYQVYDAGEISAEVCAERIQNRVSIYLSEQY